MFFAGFAPLRVTVDYERTQRRLEQKIRLQNKTPQTHSSRGTYVDQPSPKCCSIRRLN